MSTRAIPWLVGGLGLLVGCPAEPVAGQQPQDTEGLPGSSTGSSGSDEGTAEGSDGADGSDGGSTETGTDEPPATCDQIEPGGLTVDEPVIDAECPAVTDCKVDDDLDGVHFACDNAPSIFNPAQRDADGDLLGEPEDLCPVIAGTSDDVFDSDKDGYGNPCDNCARNLTQSNAILQDAGVPFSMWIRNVPIQRDSDGDGIGDACDNCPTVANCGGFGEETPATVLDAIPRDDPAQCQTDSDQDGIGDACQGVQDRGAAGATGFGAADDFDQDGLSNLDDACPRLWHDAATCADQDDCGPGSACVGGRCNHPDTDGDGVGDACDTCPDAPNPDQALSLAAAAMDDEDGDFIGAACEPDANCQGRADARPLGFFDVVAEGQCCVRTWPLQTLYDTDGLPLSTDCSDAVGPCREVPVQVALARTTMPAACEVALAEACREEASPVTLDDVDGDLAALWAHVCQLPPLDQDADGIGDNCDLCPFRHDPSNASYVDANGMMWPNDGAACNGENSLTELDPGAGCIPGA